MTSGLLDFDDYLRSLRDLTSVTRPTPASSLQTYRDAAEVMQALEPVDRKTLSRMIAAHPHWVLILGSIVGLSQEQLKNILRHRLGSSGYVTLARSRANELIEVLEDYDLVQQITAERNRKWTYGDVLFERMASTGRAGRAVRRGRLLEDEVESVV